MTKTIHWFRRDLRLHDNPALFEAAQQGQVLPLYILTKNEAENLGAASRWWLEQSLSKLNEELGGKLMVMQGEPVEILRRLVQEFQIDFINWNRRFEPKELSYDVEVQSVFENVSIFNGSLLWDKVLKADGTPYYVFTKFFRNGCLKNPAGPRVPLAKPDLVFVDYANTTRIKSLNLKKSARTFAKHWQAGAKAAVEKLNAFLKQKLCDYKSLRNFPATDSVSRLSPHLHFGEISPNQIWHAAQAYSCSSQEDVECFLSELCWREFCYSWLQNFPSMAIKNFQTKFDAFAWSSDAGLLEKWQNGTTGYPIVDAGMRQLYETGYMHNRVRMITASFLVKNLMIDWRAGQEWFWDCLLDADMANNSANWQWVAGCGLDAVPYFRIFNPITQAKKFDSEGSYVRRYLPELAHLPNKYIFEPWLCTSGIKYPKPIVDLKISRETALQKFKALSNNNLRGQL